MDIAGIATAALSGLGAAAAGVGAVWKFRLEKSRTEAEDLRLRGARLMDLLEKQATSALEKADALERAHNAAIAAMRAEHQTEIDSMRREHRLQMATSVTSYEARITDVLDKYTRVASDFETTVIQLRGCREASKLMQDKLVSLTGMADY